MFKNAKDWVVAHKLETGLIVFAIVVAIAVFS